MGTFRDLPINRKINWAILSTSIVALLISGVTIISYELSSFRRTALHDLNILAGVVGSNSTGALAFQDAAAATEVLSNLNEEPSILGARLYDKNGKPFASYVRSNHSAADLLPERALSEQQIIGKDRIRLFKKIRYKGGDAIGTIYVDFSLDRVRARIWRYAGIVTLVIFLLFPLVLVVSIGLQRIITNPLQELALVASEVAENKNYSVRAKKISQDEIGQLTDTLNHMLDSIESRDKKLVQQADELWRSNKELEQFAYISSHDLQEPLRKVTVFAQLLEQETTDDGKHNIKKYVENIRISTTRMRNLIQDLLSYSRLHGSEEAREMVNLNDIVKQVVSDMEETILQKKAKVIVGPLPTVDASPSQMTQLFQNLIGNALKFQGDTSPLVEVDSEEKDGMFSFWVKDNGIGIDGKYKEQIFKVFQRLHGKEAYPGTGIGLAICKKIVEQMGGKIWVESTPGKGATFHFTLPRS